MPDSPAYFLAFAIAGGVGALIMLLMVKRRGARGYVMAGAFVCFALANLGNYLAWPKSALWFFGIILILMLIADIVLKASTQKP